MNTITDMWDMLTEYGVSEHTLQIVTSINGYSADTLEDVLFAHMGLTSFDQLEDEDEDEDEDELGGERFRFADWTRA